MTLFAEPFPLIMFSHRFTIKEKPAIQHGRLEDGGEEEELLLLVVDGLGTNYFVGHI